MDSVVLTVISYGKPGSQRVKDPCTGGRHICYDFGVSTPLNVLAESLVPSRGRRQGLISRGNTEQSQIEKATRFPAFTYVNESILQSL